MQILLICAAAAIFCMAIVLVVGWVYFRRRLTNIESRLDALASGGPRPIEPARKPVPAFVPATPHRSTEDWETLLGGNWLNKAGVFVLVVGIALALGYSFTRVGPVGRVCVSVATGLAMLAAGAILEPRERYQTFARGLLGGGWAALYITVYAMHRVEAAKVIANPAAGFLLLFLVAGGMIIHSLRYRSLTVTGMAYLAAFGALALTEVHGLPLVAMIPLAVSLLYVAHRFEWPQVALLGVISTYAICVLRGEAGSSLWQTQAVLTVYWLLFEAFDVVHPNASLLPLNAAGFLGLSLLKWHDAAPERAWILLAASAAAYLASMRIRWRSGRWKGAATLAGALAAAAIFQSLGHQWVATALAVEAELLYLAGIRLRSSYLRWLGTSLFGVQLARLLLIDLWTLPPAAWTPVASMNAVLFYTNRALWSEDFFYSFAGASMLGVLTWRILPSEYLALGWIALALLLLEMSLRGFPAEFRYQAHGLGLLAFVRGWWFNFDQHGFAASAGVSVLLIAGLYAAQYRLPRGDRARPFYCFLGTTLTSLLMAYKISGSLLTMAWGIQGLALLASGFPLRDRFLRISGLTLLLVCILKLFVWDLRHLETLPRILSFLVLGLILVGVSWVYTRFRERVEKYL